MRCTTLPTCPSDHVHSLCLRMLNLLLADKQIYVNIAIRSISAFLKKRRKPPSKKSEITQRLHRKGSSDIEQISGSFSLSQLTFLQ